jgi:hypothetical protein
VISVFVAKSDGSVVECERKKEVRDESKGFPE